MFLNIIRWLAVIPAVLLARGLAMKPLMPVVLAAERLGPRIGYILHMTISVIAYFIYGAVLVLVGGWVAPSHKNVVVVIVAVFSIIEAWRRCYIFSHFTKAAYLNAVATALGSITVALIF